MHKSVLIKEVIEYLSPQAGENFIDCTFGHGGHTRAILDKNGPGKVLGLDLDEKNLNWFCAQNPSTDPRLTLVRSNFSDLSRVVAERNFGPVSGILLDLGMSSWHLEESGKGFSFSKDEPLDMRYSGDGPVTAQDIVNTWTKDALENILTVYGEERFARKIADRIVKARAQKKIETTAGLVGVIGRAIPGRFKGGKTNFATRTFQALRIAVNEELKSLEAVLPQAYETLVPGGRLVAISFHSLEDRIVKNYFRRIAAEEKAVLLTKKPVVPSLEEVRTNLRSRSAKLRAVKKP